MMATMRLTTCWQFLAYAGQQKQTGLLEKIVAKYAHPPQRQLRLTKKT
jgi:hypothetical protein